MTENASFRCGTVTLLGQPNVGKSTLLNRILGEKVSIVTPKPQTTRNRIVGVLQASDSQVIFLDTPGYTERSGDMYKRMRASARDAAGDADVVVFVIDASASEKLTEHDRRLLAMGAESGAPIIVVLNKVDRVKPKDRLLPFIQDMMGVQGVAVVIPVCARNGDGIDPLLQEIRERLPVGDRLFPEDIYTNASERFLCGELVREQLLLQLRQEIPHGTAVVIETFEDARDEDGGGICHVEGRIVVPRESHKVIVLGKGGERIREMSTEARINMEKLLGSKVFLRMFVVVHSDWMSSPGALEEYGVGT